MYPFLTFQVKRDAVYAAHGMLRLHSGALLSLVTDAPRPIRATPRADHAVRTLPQVGGVICAPTTNGSQSRHAPRGAAGPGRRPPGGHVQPHTERSRAPVAPPGECRVYGVVSWPCGRDVGSD